MSKTPKPKSLAECVNRAYHKDRKHGGKAWLDTSSGEWADHLTDTLVDEQAPALDLDQAQQQELRKGVQMSELRRMAYLGIRSEAQKIEIAEKPTDPHQGHFKNIDPDGFGSIFDLGKARVIGVESGTHMRLAPRHWQWAHFEKYSDYLDSRVTSLTAGQVEKDKVKKMVGDWWEAHPLTSWPEVIRRFGLDQTEAASA